MGKEKYNRLSYYNYDDEELERNELDFDIKWDIDLDDEYSWFAQITTEEHDKFYKILLDKGIEF